MSIQNAQDRRGGTAKLARAAAALACSAALLTGCTQPVPSLEELDFDAYDAVIEQVVAALESEGVIEPGTAEFSERAAQPEEDRCRLFASDADATVAEALAADDMITAVEPALLETGFDALEATDRPGGSQRILGTDDYGAELRVTWKNSSIRIGIEAQADLDEAACTDDAIR